MMPLALILAKQGHRVYGSDRSHDKGESPEKFAGLKEAGIMLYPQDGSGVTDTVDVLVVSSAVESDIPDVRQAQALGIPIQKRAEILAALFNGARGIAVGGTSGKTTVTGMIGHILYGTGRDPTVMCGGQVTNFAAAGLGGGNALVGAGDLFVAETDESDGSIALFEPAVAVLNNIALDHKPLEELRPLFRDFLGRAREAAVINLDDPEAAALADIHPNAMTFSLENEAADMTARALDLSLQVPGEHNIANALAALAAAQVVGVPQAEALTALQGFRGIRRRYDIVGVANDITVIDDFAHNPDKIAATLKTVTESGGRVIAIFQPHGFGPTKMLKDDLIATFTTYLAAADHLVMPEIYYAGGTADKSISSRDIIEAVAAQGRTARYFERRADIVPYLAETAQPGDYIVIMGARDDTLTDFAQAVLSSLRQKAA